MQVESATVWLKEDSYLPPENDGTFNIQPIVALSSSLKVEGAPHDDIPRAQSQTPQHLARTMVVPPTTSPAPVFRSVVTLYLSRLNNSVSCEK